MVLNANLQFIALSIQRIVLFMGLRQKSPVALFQNFKARLEGNGLPGRKHQVLWSGRAFDHSCDLHRTLCIIRTAFQPQSTVVLLMSWIAESSPPSKNKRKVHGGRGIPLGTYSHSLRLGSSERNRNV